VKGAAATHDQEPDMTSDILEPHLVESLQNAAKEILETMVFMTPDRIE